MSGRRVLVTGASAGIGREVALGLAGSGAELILVARRQELLDDVASQARALGAVAHTYSCDLSDPDQVAVLAKQVIALHDGVDVLINNAGRSLRRSLADTTDRLDDFERVMRLNYFGAVWLTVPLVAHMRRRGGGHVVNVSTIATRVGAQPRFSAYLASKGALEHFSRSVAPETAADGVRWSVVNMPLVRTDMIAPTAQYDGVPAMSPAAGAQLVFDAVVTQATRVGSPLGAVLHVADQVAPGLLDRVLGWPFGRTPPAPLPRVAIIGAGISGLAMAMKLRAAGSDRFTIFEKGDTVGGTWRENTYPGLTCDVPSPYYTFKDHPNPAWSHVFSPGSEIQDYLERVAEERDLTSNIEFGTEIVEGRFVDGHWVLTTATGAEHIADVLVCATGTLHHPRIPAIDGMESFAGKLFHSARWDHSTVVEGARVGVIGTGSTGVQITSALAGVAAHVTQFQRKPHWIATVPNPAIPGIAQTALLRVPGLTGATYTLLRWTFDLLARATTEPSWQRILVGGAARHSVGKVKDPQLRAQLTPTDEPLCKRLIFSPGFYRAVQRRDVDVVNSGIDHIRPDGVVTGDGRLHELDVLVLATGFDAQAYMRPMKLTGRDGITLEQAWSEGPKAYNTAAIPGLPNLFMLIGPNSPFGNSSLVPVAETQAGYVVKCLQWMRDRGLSEIEPTEQAAGSFASKIKSGMHGTIWTSGCDSWYLGPDGTPMLWPWSMRRLTSLLDAPVENDFITTAHRAAAGSHGGPVGSRTASRSATHETVNGMNSAETSMMSDIDPVR